MMMNCVCKMIDQQMYYKKLELELVTGCQICSEVLFIDSSPGCFDVLIHIGF